jgi:hypothetical protein
MPNSSMRPKGGRAAAAEPTEVSRLLNAVRDPCRKPNGSMRPKGGSGAVVEATGQGALGDPCRLPNGSVRPKGGGGRAYRSQSFAQCSTRPLP